MHCALCLERANEPSAFIELKSIEATTLDVQRIVEQHFWLKFTDNAENCICRNCWQYTQTFHEFYRRIEQAHNPLEELALKIGCDVELIESKPLPQLVVHCENVTEIKVEPNHFEEEFEEMAVNAAEPAADIDQLATSKSEEPTEEKPDTTATRRRRGRPRKCVLAQIKQKRAKKLENDDEEYKPSTERPKRKYQRRLPAKVEQEHEDEEEEEFLSEKETNKGGDFSGSEHDGDYEQPKLENCESDEENETGRHRSPQSKRTPKEKQLISKQFDDYIARNFKLSCCLCQASLKDFNKLKLHFRVEHKIRGYVSCCKKKFLKRGVLVDHLRTHENPEYFKCPQCGKVMADRRCLDLHLKMHEGVRERTYQCEICSKAFFKVAIYKRHLLMHIPEEQRKEICSICSKAFPTTYTLTQHMRLVHLNTYTRICDVCGKGIRGREALKRHMEEHSGLPQVTIQCEECGIVVTTKYGLTRHMKTMHSAEYRQPVACKLCDKMSPSLQAHKGHMKYMHTTERKHQCPMCDKAFKRPKELREHLTTHTGEVLYACPHCPKTFNSNANMHSHRKKMHRAEWEARREQRFKPTVHIRQIQNPRDQDVQVEMVVQKVQQIAEAQTSS